MTEANSDFAIAFWIGPIPIPWYGLMLLFGFLLVFLITYIEWKKKKYKTFDLFLLFFVGVIVAIFGARWWYLLFNPKDFNGFISIFQVGEGRSILGSIFAILIWLYIYTTYFASYIEFRVSFSIIIPNILIGQAIGRWGNFFDQNVYGQIATSGLDFLPDFINKHMLIDGYYRQPLFLYESILDFFGWIIIALFLKTSTKIKPGVHGGFYLFWYGTVRASLELLRDDKYIMKIGDVPTSFILSFFFLAYGIILMIYYQYYFERIAIFNHTFGKFYYETKRKNFRLWTLSIFNYRDNKKYKNLINQNNLNYNNFKKFYPQNEYLDVIKKYKREYKVLTKEAKKMETIDLLIVGGGPSGLAAAIYGARANLKTVVVEKGVPGGKLLNTNKIDNYPGFKELSGTDLAIKFIDQAKFLGAKIEGDEVLKIENINDDYKTVILGSGKKYKTKTIILATGMNPKKIPLKEYDIYFGHGISTCIVCDGAFYKNKDIAVIGGGTSASEESLFASNIVGNIYIINLFDKLDVVDSVKNSIAKTKNIHLKHNSELIKINGDGKNISSITIRNTKTKKSENINVSGVFSYIGWVPASGFLKDNKILNKDKFITINFKTGSTGIKGVFAAGDIATKEYHQITGAVSDGTNAALSAKKYIDTL